MNAIKEAHYNLGIAYLEAGQYNRAIPEFEAAIKLDANFIGAHCALCRAYLEQGELEKAGTAVTAARQLDTAHQPALLLHGTIVEAYHDKGKTYLDEKRYTQAVTAFQKAIALDADLADSSQTSRLENTHIYAHLGAAYIGMKAYQNAIDALENAISRDPDLVDAHFHLGHAYIEQGHPRKAIPHLERAIAISPNLKRAHYNLARAYWESGNLEAATHAVRETLRLDPNYQSARELADGIKQAHHSKGLTYLNDEHYNEAAIAFQNAVTLDPDCITAHYNLGLTYLKMETYARAVDALQKTIALDSTSADAHHALALAYFGQHELGKARDAARNALKLNPNYQPARLFLEAIDPNFTPSETQTAEPSESDETKTALAQTDTTRDLERGLIFLNNRQYNQAVAAFERVIKTDANSVEAHYGLGQAYLGIEAFDDAKAAAEEVLLRNPNHQSTRELLQLIKFARNRDRKHDIRKKVLAYAVIFGIVAVGAFIAIKPDIIPWSNRNLNLLIAEISLVEDSSRKKNNFLDAGETTYLNFIIRNNGSKAGNIEIRIQPSFIDGVNFENLKKIKKIPENRDMNISIPMTADQDVKGKKVDLHIQLLGKIGLFGETEPLATTKYTLTIISDTPAPVPPQF